MKSNQIKEKSSSKLNLEKKAIAKLNSNNLAFLLGGNNAVQANETISPATTDTTSFFNTSWCPVPTMTA